MRILPSEAQIIIVMISTKRLRENDDLDACISILRIFWFVTELSENLLVRSPKCRFNDKLKTMILEVSLRVF